MRLSSREKTMRWSVVALLIAFFVFIAVIGTCCTSATVHVGGDDSKMATSSPAVSDFHLVEADGAMDVHVTSGATASVKFEARSDVLPFLTSEVKDGVLVIGMKPGFDGDTGDITATVVAPKVDGVTLNGSGNVDVDAVKSDNFVGKIEGSGNLTAKGTAESASFTLSGSGNIIANDLLAKSVKVDISGSGDAKVHADKQLDASVAGSGDVHYSGKPNVVSNIAGSGSVEPAE